MGLKYVLFLVLSIFSVHGQCNEMKVEKFLKNCYSDYISARSITGKKGAALSAKIRRRCISKDFQSKWDKIVSADEGTGADGLLLAQDFFDSWKTDFKVKSHNIKDRSADVILGKSSEEKCLVVKYSDANSKLKISSVLECP